MGSGKGKDKRIKVTAINSNPKIKPYNILMNDMKINPKIMENARIDTLLSHYQQPLSKHYLGGRKEEYTNEDLSYIMTELTKDLLINNVKVYGMGVPSGALEEIHNGISNLSPDDFKAIVLKGKTDKDLAKITLYYKDMKIANTNQGNDDFIKNKHLNANRRGSGFMVSAAASLLLSAFKNKKKTRVSFLSINEDY